MTNLLLPEKIKENVLNYILQTHETKTQQNEFKSFEETMPPSKKSYLNALNFKKVLYDAPNMIALRISMRRDFLKRLADKRNSITDLSNPNKSQPDMHAGEKEFRKLIKKMVSGLTVSHVKPEEIVIM